MSHKRHRVTNFHLFLPGKNSNYRKRRNEHSKRNMVLIWCQIITTNLQRWYLMAMEHMPVIRLHILLPITANIQSVQGTTDTWRMAADDMDDENDTLRRDFQYCPVVYDERGSTSGPHIYPSCRSNFYLLVATNVPWNFAGFFAQIPNTLYFVVITLHLPTPKFAQIVLLCSNLTDCHSSE